MKLKEYLKKNCINKAAFARKAGMPVMTLYRVIDGKPIRAVTAEKVAKASNYEVDVRDLIPTLQPEPTQVLRQGSVEDG